MNSERKTINIFILMAGRGERFRQQGFDVVKPLILWNGRPLFSWALESVKNISGSQVHLVTCAEDQIRGLPPGVIELPHRTSGPADTALRAIQGKLSGPVIFCDCDLICVSQAWEKFVENWPENVDGALIWFAADELKHSFVQTDEQGRALAVAEKEKISEKAVAGVYAFRDQETFVSAARGLDFSQGEKYISHVYQNLLKQNKNIQTFKADTIRLLGTPDDLVRSKAYTV